MAGARLSDARFAAYGDTLYPDATFTLRISYGKVQGWEERGRMVPYQTTLGGTFERATGAEPFDLAPAFAAAVDAAIADGSYRAVLDRWGVQADAVPRSLVNPPGLPKS